MKMSRNIVVILWVFCAQTGWAFAPNANEIYQKLIPLFSSGGSVYASTWGLPIFEENGIPIWRWGNGQLSYISGADGINIAYYVEIADSVEKMDSKLLERYHYLKDGFASILGEGYIDQKGEIKAQGVDSISRVWMKDSLRLGWLCFYNQQMQTTTLQFILMRHQ